MTSGSWIKGRANTLYRTPTITPLLLYEYTRDNPERIDDPRWHEGLPEEIVEDIYASLQDLQCLPYYQLMPIRRPTLQRKIQQLREAGVVMLIGTDSGVPLTFHTDSTWREIDYLGRDIRLRCHGSDSRRDLLAFADDGCFRRCRETGRGQGRRHHRGAWRRALALNGDDRRVELGKIRPQILLRYPSLLQDVDLVIHKGRRVK